MGDDVSTPVVFTDVQEFEHPEDVEDFMECVELWHREYPKPNGNFNPFRKVKTPATEEQLIEILDKLHGPMELWYDNMVYSPMQLDEPLPSFMQ
jgi:hypothetical protein